MYKCKYFKIQELVSPIVYERYGEFAWSFFDENMLRDLDYIRQLWKSPLKINDWSWGGKYQESGLRCNVDSLVCNKTQPYLSGHVLGKGFDLKPKDLKNCKKLYDIILEKQIHLKGVKRLEDFNKTPTWIHIDGLNTDSNKIVIF